MKLSEKIVKLRKAKG